MDRFLTLNYYFAIRPEVNFQFSKLFLFIAVFLFLSAFLIKFYRKKYEKDSIRKKIIKKYPDKILIFASIFTFLWLCREASIPLLSMRLFLFIWALSFFYVILKNLLSFKSNYNYRLKRKNENIKAKKWIKK